MKTSYYISDRPSMKDHLVFTDDFNDGYSAINGRLRYGESAKSIASELRLSHPSVFSSMKAYFYAKGEWAAVMDGM